MNTPQEPTDANAEPRELVAADVLAREAGVALEVVHGFISHGLVEPEGAARGQRLFRREAVTVVARAARLRRDLELDDAGAALACELLARIEELEARLARYEAQATSADPL